jgi:hypothetical protein
VTGELLVDGGDLGLLIVLGLLGGGFLVGCELLLDDLRDPLFLGQLLGLRLLVGQREHVVVQLPEQLLRERGVVGDVDADGVEELPLGHQAIELRGLRLDLGERLRALRGLLGGERRPLLGPRDADELGGDVNFGRLRVRRRSSRGTLGARRRRRRRNGNSRPGRGVVRSRRVGSGTSRTRRTGSVR